MGHQCPCNRAGFCHVVYPKQNHKPCRNANVRLFFSQTMVKKRLQSDRLSGRFFKADGKDDLFRTQYGLCLPVPETNLALIRQKRALLLRKSFIPLSVFPLGTGLQPEMTANSTYWRANIFSDDQQSWETGKTTVFESRYFSGIYGIITCSCLKGT